MTKDHILFLRDLAKGGFLEGSHQGVYVSHLPDNGSAREYVISVVGEGEIFGSREELLAFTVGANMTDLDILIQT